MRLALALAAALLALSAGVAAAATLPKPLLITFNAITSQKKGSTSCPAGTVGVQGKARSGAAATARLCLLDQKKMSKTVKIITSRATITVAGLSGNLEALVRIVETTKGRTAHRKITGIIYPGTGAFANAGGRVFGQGTIAFPKQGRPKVHLKFVFGFD